jgi:FlaA1/EpsC-like NDP-sugar epimerase
MNKRAQYLMDLIVIAGAFTLAYLIRFDFLVTTTDFERYLIQLPYVALLQFAVLLLAGIYRFIWRYVGLREMRRFLLAAVVSIIPIIILRLALPDSYIAWRVPFSIALIDTALAFGGVFALRILRRDIYEQGLRKKKRNLVSHGKPVILIGAGRAGVLAVTEIQNRRDVDLDIKGFVDDDTSKVGSSVNGVKVLGTTEQLPKLARELNIDHVIISIAQGSRRDFKRLLDICDKARVKVRVIPAMHEILQGNVKVSRIRDVEIEDLLGREPICLDEPSISRILTDQVVMVTGGGGSIGSELARQVARYQPRSLLLVERAEFALFSIEREIRRAWPDLNLVSLIADVGDESRMRSILASYKPHVILHAGAHKHVPMMETNASEAIKNNVLATSLLGSLAGEHGVDTFVLISTDKAVRPTSVMGASKRVAELVVQDLNNKYQTKYVAVRFGNVIGSTGSVIPIFREQIIKGGPVTVTHPEMVRYFMTIPEAAQLVLQAGAIGEGGEIFILDMGEPVRILDLAKSVISLSGLKPFEDIDIVFTGVRSGEKLFEELQTTGEVMEKTKHSKIFIGRITGEPAERVRVLLNELSLLSKNGWEQEIRRVLNVFLPEARLDETREPSIEAIPREELSASVTSGR